MGNLNESTLRRVSVDDIIIDKDRQQQHGPDDEPDGNEPTPPDNPWPDDGDDEEDQEGPDDENPPDDELGPDDEEDPDQQDNETPGGKAKDQGKSGARGSDGVAGVWDGTDRTGEFDLSSLDGEEDDTPADYDPDDPWLRADALDPDKVQQQEDIMRDLADQMTNDGESDYSGWDDDPPDITTIDGSELEEKEPASMSDLKSIQMVSDTAKLYKLLKKAIMKATGIREKYDPATPSRKVQGLFGKDIEVPTIKNIVILLDISGSMGTPQFRAILSQLTAIAGKFKEVMGRAQVTMVCWDDMQDPPLIYKYPGFNSKTLAKMLVDGNHQRGGTEAESGWFAMIKHVTKPDLILFCSDGGFSWSGQKGADAIVHKYCRKTVHLMVCPTQERFVEWGIGGLARMDPDFHRRTILVSSSLARRME